ncbi:MAG TPA: ferritin family protein [Sedimentisphaerales bacterium]|nr:ferritin family protein [Sedimentisphaerales bacterium]
MTRKFNAIEVFEIAEQIERNGAVFYRRAAELFKDSDVAGLFTTLADWEARHEAILAGMRKELSAAPPELSAFDPEELPLDAKTMAGLAAFGLQPDPSRELAGCKTRADALKLAIQKEKDTIVYYTGLKEFVRLAAVIDKISDIIREELRHIGILNQALEQCE